MNAYELADWLKKESQAGWHDGFGIKLAEAANMLRQQADRIAELEKKQSIKLTLNRKTGGLVAMQAPQTHQLSDEEIVKLGLDYFYWQGKTRRFDVVKFARAIEAKVRGEK
jgi:hypothetical protein